MTGIYRILDANFNRAREALRVAEDFARFVLDDPILSGQAKNLRSELAEVYAQMPAAQMLAARDTLGDVGTTLTSPGELRRSDHRDVAAAACKRLTEALRTLEEYAKVVAPAAAGPLEAMRYAAYTLEQQLAHRLAVGERFAAVRLYVLVTSFLCRRDPVATAEAAIAGGADCLQLREKEMPDLPRLELAQRMRRLTADKGVLFIMNDRPDLAELVHADGVHLGQDDLPTAVARRIVGDMLIGRSTHNIAQARAAAAEGTDYVALGPMFPTSTKDAGPIAGPALLREAAGEIHRPLVCIGGITANNVDELVHSGARCVAVCSAVIGSDDPTAAAKAIRGKFTSHGDGVSKPLPL